MTWIDNLGLGGIKFSASSPSQAPAAGKTQFADLSKPSGSDGFVRSTNFGASSQGVKQPSLSSAEWGNILGNLDPSQLNSNVVNGLKNGSFLA